MTMEQRVSRLEGAYEQVDRRLSDLNGSVESLRSEIGTLRQDMDRKLTAMVLFMGGSWVTLMGTIIGLYVAG